MGSEGTGEPRLEAEGELALARLALDAGELAHAATHTGYAIATDPSLHAVYELLDELPKATPDAQALFPVVGTPFVGTVAARSYLAAREGKLDEAFYLLCRAAESVPGKPWAAGWLAAPGTSERALARRMNPDIAALALMRLSLSLPDPVEAETAATLEPFLNVARVVVTLHPEPAKVLPRLSGLARRMDKLDEAIDWCERAEKSDRSAMAAIMLGYALRNAGRPDEGHRAWLRALRRDPGNVDLRVDIAEHLAARGRVDEGIKWLDKALALRPDHPKAFPSACQMRYGKDGDIAHLVRLADWWREHPEHQYADKMLAKACSGKYWLSLVPNNPAEAEGHYRLRTYRGTEAAKAVAAPSPRAIAALQSVAVSGGVWPHPISAYDTAMPLSALSLDDLLGLLAHGVPVPRDNAPWQRMRAADPAYWPRFTRAWACLGLLHHKADEPWPDSTRRRVLLDLVRGMEDRATDAALNAMVTAAWTDPGIRPDVTDIVGARFADAMLASRHRAETIANSLAHLVLITPGMPAEATSAANLVIGRDSAGETGAGETGAAPTAQPRRRRFRRRP